MFPAPISPSSRQGSAPYSPGMAANGFVFVAGQVPLDESGDLVARGDYTGQTTQVIANVAAVLETVGAGLEHVVAVNAYLADRSGVDEYNKAYVAAFGEHRPARVTVIADLVRPEYLVEISAVAIDPRTHPES